MGLVTKTVVLARFNGRWVATLIVAMIQARSQGGGAIEPHFSIIYSHLNDTTLSRFSEYNIEKLGAAWRWGYIQIEAQSFSYGHNNSGASDGSRGDSIQTPLAW